MDCFFDQSLAVNYKSHSQAVRILTETWTVSNMYCPRCGNLKLLHFPNNRAVADFFCPECKNEYELKSKKGKLGHKIVDGSYDTFIQRITSNNNPDFFIMTYDPYSLCVENLWIVPKHFFTPAIIQKRKPLSHDARRSGWVGCSILFNEIPQQGRISIIQQGVAVEKNEVIAKMSRASLFAAHNLDTRGWLLDILNCINNIPKEIFSLNEMYLFENELQIRHPQNKNIRPKIRQQLQILRDKGFLEFIDRGYYRKKDNG